MRKSLHTTLILTGICVLLLTWYLAYEKRVKPQNKDAEEKSKQLVSLQKDDIQEVELARMTNSPPEGAAVPPDFKPIYETIMLKKSGNDWTMTSPVQDTADANAVGSMLSTLTTTKQDRIIDENPKDVAPFGLKDPIVRIRVRKDSSSPPQDLLIGANTPTGFNSYARVGGKNTVYRVPRSLRTGLDKPSKDFRNKSIAPFSRVEVAEVDFVVGKDEFIVKKEENRDEWTLARDGIPADGGEWNKTLNALLEAKALEFPQVDPKDGAKAGLAAFGLAKPKARITMSKRDTSKATLLVGSVKDGKGKDAKDKYYAKREDKDVVYEVDKDFGEKVTRPVGVYRSLALAKFNRYDVQRIKLERAKDSVELVKDGTKWSATASPTTAIDPNKVDVLLTKLQDIKFEKYLPEKTPKVGEKNRWLVVRVFEKKMAPPSIPPPSKDGKAPPQAPPAATEQEKVVLTFAKPKGNEVVGERGDLPLRFSLKASDFKTLDLSQQDFIQEKKEPAPQSKQPPVPDTKKKS